MANAELSYLKPEETMEKSPMQNFYAGKCIFLTGATGFMGKVISEKLMRTCPDIKAIYMLIRPKKGKEINKRFEEIFNDPVSSKHKDLFIDNILYNLGKNMWAFIVVFKREINTKAAEPVENEQISWREPSQVYSI
jgi:NAD dependent epimerase/dehydratase family enzyme